MKQFAVVFLRLLHYHPLIKFRSKQKHAPDSGTPFKMLFRATKSTWLFRIARSRRLPFSSSSRIFETLTRFSGKSNGREPNLYAFLIFVLDRLLLGNCNERLSLLILRHSHGSKSSSSSTIPLFGSRFSPDDNNKSDGWTPLVAAHGDRSSFDTLLPRNDAKLSRLELQGWIYNNNNWAIRIEFK